MYAAYMRDLAAEKLQGEPAGFLSFGFLVSCFVLYFSAVKYTDNRSLH